MESFDAKLNIYFVPLSNSPVCKPLIWKIRAPSGSLPFCTLALIFFSFLF